MTMHILQQQCNKSSNTLAMITCPCIFSNNVTTHQLHSYAMSFTAIATSKCFHQIMWQQDYKALILYWERVILGWFWEKLLHITLWVYIYILWVYTKSFVFICIILESSKKLNVLWYALNIDITLPLNKVSCICNKPSIIHQAPYLKKHSLLPDSSCWISAWSSRSRNEYARIGQLIKPLGCKYIMQGSSKILEFACSDKI